MNWVQCDRCEEWYHLLCVGLSSEEVTEDEEYECFKCKNKDTPSPFLSPGMTSTDSRSSYTPNTSTVDITDIETPFIPPAARIQPDLDFVSGPFESPPSKSSENISIDTLRSSGNISNFSTTINQIPQTLPSEVMHEEECESMDIVDHAASEIVVTDSSSSVGNVEVETVPALQAQESGIIDVEQNVVEEIANELVASASQSVDVSEIDITTTTEAVIDSETKPSDHEQNLNVSQQSKDFLDDIIS